MGNPRISRTYNLGMLQPKYRRNVPRQSLQTTLEPPKIANVKLGPIRSGPVLLRDGEENIITKKNHLYPLVIEHSHRKSPFSMGKLTVSMAIFNGYLDITIISCCTSKRPALNAAPRWLRRCAQALCQWCPWCPWCPWCQKGQIARVQHGTTA